MSLKTIPQFVLKKRLRRQKSLMTWIVVDARTTQNAEATRVARFVKGMTSALVHHLSQQKRLKKKTKVLILSKTEAPEWVVSLVHKYPQVSSSWCGGPGLLQSLFDRPRWLWPTLILKYIQKITSNRFLWIAPDNFDRPLFISRKPTHAKIIQVVQDITPLLPLKGISFRLKSCFRFFVKRTLHKIPSVATICLPSAQMLETSLKKRNQPISIIPDAIDPIFGQNRYIDTKEKQERRGVFLGDFIDQADIFDLEKIKNLKWIVGIGGSQKYKNWNLPFRSVELLNHKVQDEKYGLVRINADYHEISSYKKKFPHVKSKKLMFFPDLNLLFISQVKEEQIIDIYKMSDVLVNPSPVENFGHHALEASLMGIPVVFKKGTSIDSHFQENVLPKCFWNGLASNDVSDWAHEIEYSYLSLFSNDDPQTAQFYSALKTAPSTREFLIKYAHAKDFSWEESAKSIHKIILKKLMIGEK